MTIRENTSDTIINRMCGQQSTVSTILVKWRWGREYSRTFFIFLVQKSKFFCYLYLCINWFGVHNYFRNIVEFNLSFLTMFLIKYVILKIVWIDYSLRLLPALHWAQQTLYIHTLQIPIYYSINRRRFWFDTYDLHKNSNPTYIEQITRKIFIIAICTFVYIIMRTFQFISFLNIFATRSLLSVQTYSPVGNK